MYPLPPPLTSLYPPTLSPHITRLPGVRGITSQHPVQVEDQQQMRGINHPITRVHSQSPREYLRPERDMEQERTHHLTNTSSEAEYPSSSPNRQNSKNGRESVEEIEGRSTSVVKYAYSADSNRAPAAFSDNKHHHSSTHSQTPATFLEDSPLTFTVIKPALKPCYDTEIVTNKVCKKIPPLLRIETEGELQSLQKSIHSQKSNWEQSQIHTKLKNSQTNSNTSEIITVQYYNNPYYKEHSSLGTSSFQCKRHHTNTSGSESSEEDSDIELFHTHSHTHSLAIPCPGNDFSV